MGILIRHEDIIGRTYRLTPSALGGIFARAYVRRGSRELLMITKTFKLGKTDTGRLLGVSRQAVDQWISDGVPPARIADLGRIAQVASALRKRFRADRIPSIVRGALPGLGQRSILATLASKNGTRDVLDLLARLASFVPA